MTIFVARHATSPATQRPPRLGSARRHARSGPTPPPMGSLGGCSCTLDGRARSCGHGVSPLTPSFDPSPFRAILPKDRKRRILPRKPHFYDQLCEQHAEPSAKGLRHGSAPRQVHAAPSSCINNGIMAETRRSGPRDSKQRVCSAALSHGGWNARRRPFQATTTHDTQPYRDHR